MKLTNEHIKIDRNSFGNVESFPTEKVCVPFTVDCFACSFFYFLFLHSFVLSINYYFSQPFFVIRSRLHLIITILLALLKLKTHFQLSLHFIWILPFPISLPFRVEIIVQPMKINQLWWWTTRKKGCFFPLGIFGFPSHIEIRWGSPEMPSKL